MWGATVGRVARVVLSVALGAAAATASTVWICGHYARTQYEAGSVEFAQLARDVPRYKTIQATDIRAVRIPQVLLGAFRQAVKAEDAYVLLIDHPAPRDLFTGEFVFHHDLFQPETAFPAPEGHELLTLPIHPVSTSYDEPGRGVYALHGDFDIDPDPNELRVEVFPIITAMNRVVLSGYSSPSGRGTITICVPERLVPELLKIQWLLQSGRFFVTVAHWPAEGPHKPRINQEVTELIKKGTIDTPLNRRDDRSLKKREEA